MNFHQLISRREHEIIQLICAGLKSSEIANTLYISCYTVKDHRKNILEKLNAKNVAHMVHLYHTREFN